MSSSKPKYRNSRNCTTSLTMSMVLIYSLHVSVHLVTTHFMALSMVGTSFLVAHKRYVPYMCGGVHAMNNFASRWIKSHFFRRFYGGTTYDSFLLAQRTITQKRNEPKLNEFTHSNANANSVYLIQQKKSDKHFVETNFSHVAHLEN